MDILAEVLEKEAQENAKYKPTTVEKQIELEFDLGNLLASDTNELNLDSIKASNREAFLRDLARDDAQLLINNLWALPMERVEEIIVAKLPKLTTVLPREKHCPKPKPLTKWQKYAQEKGIAQKKKTNVKWDDILQKWVPRFGYKHADAEKQKDWVLEVPQHVDPMEDQFAKKAAAKKEKVAKNEYQRLRNIAAARKVKVPKEGLPPVDTPSSGQLSTAVTVARASTASLGRFQAKLPKEKPLKADGTVLSNKRKRPDHTTITANVERTKHLAIVEGLLSKRPTLDMEKAVNAHISGEQRERSEEKRTGKGKSAGRGGKKRRSMAPQKGKKGGGKMGAKSARMGLRGAKKPGNKRRGKK